LEKSAQKLPLMASPPVVSAESSLVLPVREAPHQSFFASFCSQKEDSSFLLRLVSAPAAMKP
jgi:hypothetical protein